MVGIYIGALAVAVVGALVVWFAYACRTGTLRPNAIIGYRTPMTLRDKVAWKAVHHSIAPFLFVSGGGAVLGAVAAAILAVVGFNTAAQGLLGIGAGWIILWVLLSIIPGRLAARAYAKALKGAA